MAHRVCPWWVGHLLASPLRRLGQDPTTVVVPFVSEGMVVLEPGPGMGFFTLELARRVGPKGRVIAVDLQVKMLKGLMHRAKKAGLEDRIDARQPKGDHLGVDDYEGQVDFALAFAMVHEVPRPEILIQDIHRALKPQGKLLIAEPKGFVNAQEFEATLTLAKHAGFTLEVQPRTRGNHVAVLSSVQKGAPAVEHLAP